MPLTVEWDDAVSVECCGTRLAFDPRRNKHFDSRVFITHAHYDHSKGFRFRESEKISTTETKELVSAYGREIALWQPLAIGDRLTIDEVEVVCHNSGHVLGSSIFEVLTPEGSLVYTGDLQVNDSFTLKGAEPIRCDILVIESTFGSRIFRFPEREEVAQEMVQWALRIIKDGRVPTFKADSLGNAQEITKAFGMYSKLPVAVHWRVAQINQIYRNHGVPLGFVDARSEDAAELTSSGECIFVAPKNANLTHQPELEPALVSGWALWTRKTQAFPLSDHADFDQLMQFVEACRPRIVLTCFGGRFNHAFAKEVEKRLGISSRALDLIRTVWVPRSTHNQHLTSASYACRP
jgi:Cft2 family RNA processing exonuclease